VNKFIHLQLEIFALLGYYAAFTGS